VVAVSEPVERARAVPSIVKPCGASDRFRLAIVIGVPLGIVARSALVKRGLCRSPGFRFPWRPIHQPSCGSASTKREGHVHLHRDRAVRVSDAAAIAGADRYVDHQTLSATSFRIVTKVLSRAPATSRKLPPSAASAIHVVAGRRAQHGLRLLMT
jgi:hypothetical protein